MATQAELKRVTRDWGAIYGEFDARRPLRLLRRIGPVVQGVTLDLNSSGDSYFPTAHIHALTRKFPVISLLMGTRLSGASGVDRAISFKLHSKSYAEAAEILSRQSRLSLAEAPSVDEIVTQLQKFVTEQQERFNLPCVREVEDSVLVASAASRPDLADECITFAAELLRKWTKGRLPPDFPGNDVWISGLSDSAADPRSIQACVDEQVKYHRLEGVRQY